MTNIISLKYSGFEYLKNFSQKKNRKKKLILFQRLRVCDKIIALYICILLPTFSYSFSYLIIYKYNIFTFSS